ncbi:bifunctional adenosylcobinamide kinase/adenosylcobinamide-phosphate guanylyltransferase [Bacillus infantis]|uniref:Adenosylcobinamide kinase n=1 Tax=Bacillus infantis TaxID=324767 RepID=A0A5D4R001_9BACI|nr:bifunctional adenosylcobinamide kinase/adenosylcobinamide-phosphate guanylyltransferase [Bacillus infantis]TYS42932.1 cobinamide kinase [Bacillus infantis]
MDSAEGLIFITGGVRSGKSTFAEKTAASRAAASNGRLHYIAAGKSSDEEMAERILLHQKQRDESGSGWRTWEQPARIGELAAAFTKQDVLLLDCLTTLLNNELFGTGGRWESPEFQEEVKERILADIHSLKESAGALIIVSNEVQYEPFEAGSVSHIYARLLGRLHQRIVGMAVQAYLVEAGIPLPMKGRKP